MTAENEFGVVGLGRIDSNLVRQALETGRHVVGPTRKEHRT